MIKVMSGKTGEICKVSGVYYCKDHPEILITVSKGDVFPGISNDQNNPTVWILKFQI
jgi:hypothetical protein